MKEVQVLEQKLGAVDKQLEETNARQEVLGMAKEDPSTLGGAAAKRYSVLKEAIDAGGFSNHSYLANQFREAQKTDKGLCPTSRKALASIRKEWLQKEFDNFKEVHFHTQSFRKVDVSLGTYRNVGQLVKAEGGGKTRKPSAAR